MFSISHATMIFEHHFRLVYDRYGRAETSDQTVEKYLTHKLRHVYGVLDATLRVIAQDQQLSTLDRKFTRDAEVVALRHDIGRFYQVREDRIVGNKEYEHGDEAALMLREQFPDQMPILLAVKYHNKFSHTQLFDDPRYQELNNQSQHEALLLTQIIRDADKLQNLTYGVFDRREAQKRFEKQTYSVGGDYRKQELTPIVVQSIADGQLVRHGDVQTFADCLLIHYSRLTDINFRSTENILIGLGVHGTMVDVLRELGVPDQQIEQIPTPEQIFAINR